MNRLLNLRETAQHIFHRTLAAIEVESVVRAQLHAAGDQLTMAGETGRFARIVVIAVGKAGEAMARAAEAALGTRITAGLLVTNAVTGPPLRRFRVLLGGHPVPNEASLAAAQTALTMLRTANDPATLVLFLISGGGSAMFEQPIDPRLTLDDLQAVNRALVGCGAVINEMNVVRRHLSAVKGGRLAAAAPRARQISLYVSDVNGNDLPTVASGPTLPSAATLDDFRRIVARYDLLNQFPPRVAELIRADAIPPLPTVDAAATGRRSHHLLLDNATALAEAKLIAERDYGLIVETADDLIEGEVEAAARVHLERLTALRAKHAGRTVCLLSGGEVICPVRGAGQGGRNQEFVLRAARLLDQAQEDGTVVLSAGTDGIDGNSPAAGATADATTVWRANQLGLSAEMHLRNSNSFNFFNALNDALIIGPTGNNVRDLRIFLTQ